MRRQYHRFFGTKALRQIFQSLPKLEQVNFEVWMHMSEAIQEYRDGGKSLNLPTFSFIL